MPHQIGTRSRLTLAVILAVVGSVLLHPWTVSPAAQDTIATAVAVTSVDIRTTTVALNASDAGQREVGRFVYAGGLELNAIKGRFGGLSDLDVLPDLRILSVTDEGQFVQARLTLDANDCLANVTDMRVQALMGLDGRPLTDKAAADAEGVSMLPNGDRLVSFERDHRIWRYPASGGAPVAVPTPPTGDFPLNGGMEALTAAPALGEGAYLAGSEAGEVWLCTLASTCRKTALGTQVPREFGLTALAISVDGQVIALATRAYDEARGVRVIIRLVDRTALDTPNAGLLDQLTLDGPLTRDNIEGISLASRPNGRVRLYLLSDNNFSETQHTYLMAFDWSRP